MAPSDSEALAQTVEYTSDGGQTPRPINPSSSSNEVIFSESVTFTMLVCVGINGSSHRIKEEGGSKYGEHSGGISYFWKMIALPKT